MDTVFTRMAIAASEEACDAFERFMIERVARRHPDFADAIEQMGEGIELSDAISWTKAHNAAYGCDMLTCEHGLGRWYGPRDVCYTGDKAWPTHTLRFSMAAEIDDIGGLELLSEASSAGLEFTVCALGIQSDVLQAWHVLQCLESSGGVLSAATPAFIAPGLPGARLDGTPGKMPVSLEQLFDACCCIDIEKCVDFASAACALMIIDELVGDAIEFHRDYERYSLRRTAIPVTLNAEVALCRRRLDADDQRARASFLEACRAALASLPVALPFEMLADSRDTKLLIPGQSVEVQAIDACDLPRQICETRIEKRVLRNPSAEPCRILATVPGKERPSAIANPELARYVVDRCSLLGATTWAGFYMLAAFLPHLRASVFKSKPAYSDDRGDSGYSCWLAFELADADVDGAIRDAIAYFEQDRHALRRSVMPRRPLEIGPCDASLAPKWPKTAAAQKKAADRLSKASARTLSTTKLAKVWSLAGLPETEAAESGLLPDGIEFIDVKSRQMGARRIRIAGAGCEETNCFTAPSTEIRPAFQEPKTFRVSQMLDQCAPQSRCSSILDGVEAISETRAEKLDSQVLLYALCAKGVIDANQLAGYRQTAVE